MFKFAKIIAARNGVALKCVIFVLFLCVAGCLQRRCGIDNGAGEGLYCVVDLDNYRLSFLKDIPEGGWTNEYKTRKMVLRKIPHGSFWFQGKALVNIPKSFYIGVFEVTREQFSRITAYVPYELAIEPVSFTRTDGLCRDRPTMPVGGVSWNEVRVTTNDICNVCKEGEREFEKLEHDHDWPNRVDAGGMSVCGILRQRTGRVFDLPTEVQWEYACKAGSSVLSTKDEGHRRLGWSIDVADWGGPKEVGLLEPNGWGLYDMLGNVAEWCRDYYVDDFLKVLNPKETYVGPLSGGDMRLRVVRGGHWQESSVSCTPESRNHMPQDNNFEPYLGFRLVMR